MNFTIFLNLTFAKYFVIALHFFGLVFMCWSPTKDFFVALTPLNLIISAILLIYHQEQKTSFFYLFACFCAFFGYFVEVIGVHTGLIFGEYCYGITLGFQIWKVPLLIGVNWAVLIIASAAIAENLLAKTNNKFNKISKSILGAVLMTGLDYLIEPIAMYLDFWQWKNNSVPLQNYVAWFFIACLLHSIYQYTNLKKQNKLAITLFIAQVLFFGVYNLVK
jgi:putative membrane protein